MPVFLIIGGAAFAALLLYEGIARASGGDYKPDYTPAPGSGKTGYKKVDAILPLLKAAADSSQIPLGLLVGWVAKESGGRLDETTKYDERGYFQLMPDESKALGLDHARLSIDPEYSVAGGVKLIQKYALLAAALGVAQQGTAYFWRLVKLAHTMGSGATKTIVDGAKAAGAAGSWPSLEKHALDNEATYLSKTKHSPSKWFPLVDKVFATGAPFGVGSGEAVVGADTLPTNADHDALSRAVESTCPHGALAEKQAVAWVCRNRARMGGATVADLVAAGFIASDALAGDESVAVARAVLALPEDADPTGGAVDFWKPHLQNRLKALGDMYRDALAGGDFERAAGLEPYAGYTATAGQVRLAYVESGVEVVGCVGEVELLK